MASHTDPRGPLTAAQIQEFIDDGYVRIEQAFPRDWAEQARAVLWRDLGLSPDNPSGWTRPVVRLGMYAQPLFQAAANTPVLHEAFNQLVGAGRWQPLGSVGSFPVRFPSGDDPGDTGWHIDVSFAEGAEPDFMRWRANLHSRGRALLVLMLFSDVGADDAPTRIRAGSHRDVARQLAPVGERGLTLAELAADGFVNSSHREEALATGRAGDVYLCHPFVVHSAQAHRGRRPRFMAQPPLLPTVELDISEGGPPVGRAIAKALQG
ncbi:MAG: phytanoyl-CoA dioxygenase family protein [Caulobacteraceae bacterium]|nr:phytanoyl-CoA dioxygenase family protein [Caulobacteraceae bacterium]